MNIQVIGLFSDIIGATLLLWGTEVLNKVVLGLLKELENVVGTVGDSNYVSPNLAKYSEQKNISKFCSIVGFLFLVFGFLLQLIGSWH